MIAIESDQPDSAIEELESSMARAGSENQVLAGLMSEIATLLANQGASKFRVNAYQNAAQTLRELRKPAGDILDDQGIAGLVALPAIGRSIANLIEQFLRLGHIGLLDRLRGDDAAERVFATLPGLGPELSRRIHEKLEIETLPELLSAVRDGRLEQVPGIGSKRAGTIGECVAERLRYRAAEQPRTSIPSRSGQAVPVSELLDVDAQYRRLAGEGKLPKIAPRKFNPGSIAWLPILHTQREDRHYTALYSNTARAHQLNTTRDWVIIYRDDPQSDGRWTVITSQFGKLHGCRIVRGREDECTEYYLSHRAGSKPH
jgi:hypothetical protein